MLGLRKILHGAACFVRGAAIAIHQMAIASEFEDEPCRPSRPYGHPCFERCMKRKERSKCSCSFHY